MDEAASGENDWLRSTMVHAFYCHMAADCDFSNLSYLTTMRRIVTTFERPRVDFDFHNSVICASMAVCAFPARFQTLVRFPLSKVSHTRTIYEAAFTPNWTPRQRCSISRWFPGRPPLIGKTEKGVVFSTERYVRLRMKISWMRTKERGKDNLTNSLPHLSVVVTWLVSYSLWLPFKMAPCFQWN